MSQWRDAFNAFAQCVVPAIVHERELLAANSGLWTAAVISQNVLCPLGGVVAAAFGYSWAFWINAASAESRCRLAPRGPRR